MSGAAAISVRGLRKAYDGHEALSGIDFDVLSGEVFGLLGPNGAGKTTTVEILEGYRERDAGNVSVLGVDPWRSDRRHPVELGPRNRLVGVDRSPKRRIRRPDRRRRGPRRRGMCRARGDVEHPPPGARHAAPFRMPSAAHVFPDRRASRTRALFARMTAGSA